MSAARLGEQWGERFGLARSPMFEREGVAVGGCHEVLLDGGRGSFGMTVANEVSDPADAASWAWSSDLPHHVTVTQDRVQVVRWDAAREAQTYSLQSVMRDLDGFYRHLCRDRLRSNQSVVQHLVTLFSRVRSIAANAKLSDDRATDVFLVVLAELMGLGGDTLASGLPIDAQALRSAVAGAGLDHAVDDVRRAPGTISALVLHPSLAVRHAGGRLFQEAHFDLIRAPSPDLFNFIGSATVARASRGGTHFTPPAIARSLVDFALAQLGDIKNRSSLTICDPACGSAAFLHETLRGLRRAGFDGALTIVGRDVSGSAIAMARYTLAVALRDWSPVGGVRVDVERGDSLAEGALPPADLTLMNPPFISVIAQTAEQRRQLRAIVGERTGSRGDYSMAFINRALDRLNGGGVLGALFPANLLTHAAVAPWRRSLSDRATVRLLASIGDFGLFSHALVQIGCAVLAKDGGAGRDVTALVTGNDPEATGDALRELRKAHGRAPVRPVRERHWMLFPVARQALEEGESWRLLTPEQRRLLEALDELQTPTANALFDIAQGVQTGSRDAFLFDEEEFRKLRLPAGERRYFRKALMSDSIKDGRIVKTYRMFFPHSANGPAFADEAAARAALPVYFEKVLGPKEQLLRGRVALNAAGRTDWWGLMRPRVTGFSFSDEPRIVSKFFGAEGSFVFDGKAEYLPSTGHVWTPRRIEAAPPASDAHGLDEPAPIGGSLLRAYTTLLNSRTFVRLVSMRSVTLQGGQYDLSSRFVGQVHLPDLARKSEDPAYAELIRLLAASEGDRGPETSPAILERAVATLYGVPELAEI